jgi:hypothetical protein
LKEIALDKQSDGLPSYFFPKKINGIKKKENKKRGKMDLFFDAMVFRNKAKPKKLKALYDFK